MSDREPAEALAPSRAQRSHARSVGAQPADHTSPPNEDLLRKVLATKRYELLDPIGGGGMGALFSARHVFLDRIVAVKVLTLPGADHRAMFLREARSLASIRHPNVVELHDFDEIEGMPVLIMELLTGESAAERLARGGPLAPREALGIVVEMLRGLAAVHEKGFVHRDIKPSNLFLERLPTGGDRTKLIDFGVCTDIGIADSLIGTPEYFAPEQINGDRLDARTDLWAVGVTLVELLTGEPPFPRGDFAELAVQIVNAPPRLCRSGAPPIPGRLEAIVHKLLAKRSEDRFGSAHELARTLEELLSGMELATTGTVPRQIVVERGRPAAPNGDEDEDEDEDLQPQRLLALDAHAAMETDAAGLVARTTDPWCRLFGVRPEQVIGRPRATALALIADSFADADGFRRRTSAPSAGPFLSHAALALRHGRGLVRWLAKTELDPSGSLRHVDWFLPSR